MQRGGVLKGTIEPGEGEAFPQLDDLVFLHYSILDTKEKVLESTRAENGGPGHPRLFILGKAGKGARPLRGVELALSDMRLRERCALQLKPEFAFLHKDCVLKPPVGFRKEEPLGVDVQLAHLISAKSKNLKSLGDTGIVMQVIKEGDGWETPRAPFDIVVKVTARSVSTDGIPQTGPIYIHSGDESGGSEKAATPIENGENNSSSSEIKCSLGDGRLPLGLETAISELRRGEEAIVWCPAHLATLQTENNISASSSSSFIFPAPPSQESLGFGGDLYPNLRYVEFTVSLLDFLQVRDLTGDGGAMKRILKKGRGDFPADCPLEDTRVKAKISVRPALKNTATNSSSTTNMTTSWVPLPVSTTSTRNTDGCDSSSVTSGSSSVIEIDLGMGQVPDPVESSLRLMLRGEVASVQSTWAHSYGKYDNDVLDKNSTESCSIIPECFTPTGGIKTTSPSAISTTISSSSSPSDVEFEIELIDFDPIPNVVSLTTAEKLTRSAKWREQGNTLFKAGKYKLARSKYMQGIKSVDQIQGVDSEEQIVTAKVAKVSCLVNLAACAQKEKEYGEVIKWCDKAIE